MSPGTRKSAKSKSILVLDGDPDDLKRLRKYLEEEGCEIVEVHNCQDAFDHVRKDAADLMLVDPAACGGEGAEFCVSLHEDPNTAALPVIAITDSRSKENGMTAINLGADDFVTRPIKRAELLVRVRMLLRVRELHTSLISRNMELEDVNKALERLNQELAARNRELEQNVEMAQRLQGALLPQQYPRVKNMSFCHLYTPADVVSGDFFQITPMSGERAAIFLCDVSGHGIRAALVTSILKAVFDYVYLEDKGVEEILSDVNSRFRSVLGQLSPHIYATGFLLVVDGEESSISVASAGHACPVLIRKRDMKCVPLMKENKIGPALGFFNEPQYVAAKRKLSRGDIVLGFTDGVYEVLNAEGEMYGLDRLREFVSHNARLIPRDLIEKIVRETDAFRGFRKRPDDVCLVAVEVH